MNARDKELAKRAGFNSFDTECYEGLDVLIDLIRADEREALDAKDWTAIMREGALVTWGDAEELGERVRAAIKARGNTCNP